MQLMLSEPKYINVLIPRLGGMGISWNFLKGIGQHTQDSGLNVKWIESDLLGGILQNMKWPETTTLMQRGHVLTKLLFEQCENCFCCNY